MDEACTSRDPETGVQCTQTGEHALHVAYGATWTNQDIEDAKDPNKVLVKEIRKTRGAIERVAKAIEDYVMEAFHKQR